MQRLARGASFALRARPSRAQTRRFVTSAAATAPRKPSTSGRGRPDGGRRAQSSSADVVQRQRRNFDGEQSANLEDARRSALTRVVVARAKANMFLDGNPIVYAGAIERVEGEARTGDWVQVTDHALSPICYGFYNETSSYSVRALSQAWERGCEDGDGVVAQRIREAYELRRDLGLVGNERTTCYRLLNSEGDKISGLNADVYGEIVVASSTAAWVEQRRDVILRAFADVLGANTKVVWRRDEKMYEVEGTPWEGENLIDYYDAATGAKVGEAVPSDVKVLEDGVQYAIDIAGGHKTGFYVDQRDNRKVMREIARGKRVLDVCCYTGGFALNAALGGASDVVAVDSSESALDMARKNAELNGVQDKVNFVRADAFDFMQAEIDAGRAGSYDVVVLDPPKFAPTKPALKKAIPKYVGLNKRAMTLLRPGGILITCSCSGAVTQERLLPKIVENASRASGVSATMLSIRGAGCDQPIDPAYAFGEYLSVVTARIA